jgi:chitin disaccharide deacetylase
MACQRSLIVNADDFGQSPGVNRGTIKTCEQGIVTSASLMVRGPAAAGAYGQERPTLSLGLHLDLGE